MKEEFLHFIWQYRLYQPDIRTTEQLQVLVKRPGEPNSDAGPDFLNALISIDGTQWAGQVEIHIRSSDWTSHGHHHDHAYDNVVLHVVYIDDESVFNARGERMPTIALSDYLSQNTVRRYLSLIGKTKSIPCARFLPEVEPVIIIKTLEKAAVEKLAERVDLLLRHYRVLNADLNVLAYESLSRAMGFRVNNDAFALMSKILKWTLLLNLQNQPSALLAVMLGTSGLLEKLTVKRIVEGLIEEWKYRSNTHSLFPMNESVWKYARTRPSNHPHRRLIQLAAFLSNCQLPFHTLARFNNLETLRSEMTEYFSIPDEWVKHGIVKDDYKISPESIDLLVINVIIPLRELSFRLDDAESDALSIMESLPPESNAIVRKWSGWGVNAQNAVQSQGCLHQYNSYCKRKRCLACGIAVKVLQ